MNDRRAKRSLIAACRPRRKARTATKKAKTYGERTAAPGTGRKWERALGPRDRVPVPPGHPDIPF